MISFYNRLVVMILVMAATIPMAFASQPTYSHTYITPDDLNSYRADAFKKPIIYYPPYALSVLDKNGKTTIYNSFSRVVKITDANFDPNAFPVLDSSGNTTYYYPSYYTKIATDTTSQTPLGCDTQADSTAVAQVIKCNGASSGVKSNPFLTQTLPLIKKKCFLSLFIKAPVGDFTYKDGNLIQINNCSNNYCAITMSYPRYSYTYSWAVSVSKSGATLHGTGIYVAGVLNFMGASLGSPFLVFSGAPVGPLSVSIHSSLDQYANTLPLFNDKNGWTFTSDKNNTLLVGNKKAEHLFYELAIKSHTLTRNGKNFSSKAELIDYLTTSDFYSKMGLTEKDRANSLGYILPKVARVSASNFYLTILDDDTIAKNSTLTITPKPDSLMRRYFAIYPTFVPVTTTGDLLFPIKSEAKGFSVKEYGEFLIDDTMEVLWK